jgi:DNA-directed RNA polymerase specialized sigma24 family protein
MPSLEEQLLAYKRDPKQINPLLEGINHLAKKRARAIDRSVDPEDIAQEVLIDMLKLLPSIQKDIVPRVLRITRHKVIDEQRKTHMKYPVEIDDQGISSPDRVSSWQRRKLEIASEVLGEQITNLLEHGYTHQEIEELTGVSISTVRARIQRARKLFLAA